MDSVLITSGYPSATVSELKRHWKIIDIRNQSQALQRLPELKETISAAVIGNASYENKPVVGANEMLEALLARDPDLPIIISTHNRDPRVIVNLVRKGAFDYVIEVADRTDIEAIFAYTQNLVLALKRAVHLRTLLRENEQLRRDARTGVPISIEAIEQPFTLPSRPGLRGLNWRETMLHCERQLVGKALRQTNGNITRAASLLGIKRTRLRYRIRQLGLNEKP
jgi:DNA-binding NtrC family response regulator